MRSLRWMMVAVLVLACTVVLASEGDSEVGQTVQWAWDQLFYLLGVAVAGFLIKVLSKLGKKYGIELDAKQKDMISNFTIDAIGYAEEWSARKFKLDNIKAKSEEKFSKAVKRLCEKLPGLTEERARELVVSNLPKFRALVEGKLKALQPPAQ